MPQISTPPTLEQLAERLMTLESRSERAERSNARLSHENQALRAELASLRASVECAHCQVDDGVPSAMSRRSMLHRAGQVALGAVTVGLLAKHDRQNAAATHSDEVILAQAVVAHELKAQNETGNIAIEGQTVSDENAGIYGSNFGNGYGIHALGGDAGIFAEGRVGVLGTGLAGGTGVRGDGSEGVYGIGYLAGVHGVSAATGGNAVFGEAIGAATGVRGTSELGYGGLFKGTRAQLRLVPTGRLGKPVSGTHTIGELYLDKVGSLFICTVAGTPGTWRKVNTVAG